MKLLLLAVVLVVALTGCGASPKASAKPLFSTKITVTHATPTTTAPPRKNQRAYLRKVRIEVPTFSRRSSDASLVNFASGECAEFALDKRTGTTETLLIKIGPTRTLSDAETARLISLIKTYCKAAY